MIPKGEKDASESRAAGRLVLMLIGGFFAIIFAANAVFVWLASDTHSGPVTEAAYDKGLDYNARLVAAAEEAALGWEMEVVANRASDGKSEIWLVIRDADGALIPGLQVDGRLVRPVTNGLDQSLSFTPDSAGLYGVALDVPQPGQWELRVLASDGANVRRFTKRLVL